MGPADNFIYESTKGVTWYLNSKNVTLRNGKEQMIYFFSKDSRDSACEMPAGFEVLETQRTGMPVLKRIR